MKRRTGYVPDLGHRRTPFARLASRLGVSPLPDSVSLLQFAPDVFDQGQTGSCTGASVAAALYTDLAAKATPLPWVPSPRGVYDVGRAIDRVPNPDGTLPGLADEGAQPNQVMRGISEFGIRPMGALVRGTYYDCDPSNVNLEPTLGELEQDAVSVVIGEYGINSVGAQRVTDVCTALAAWHPVTFAIAGGSEVFQSYTGGVLPALNAPNDHYVWALGYDTDADGARVIRCRNSWSAAWGESGDFRLSEAAVAELGDLVVLDVRLRGVA